MIEPLAGMPAGTLGFRCRGDITPADYTDVLAPALHGVVDAGGRLRSLYLIEDITEIEPRALWADTKLSVDLVVRDHAVWERTAIVSDVEWIVRGARMFTWLIPGEARVFAVAELDRAIAWTATGVTG